MKLIDKDALSMELMNEVLNAYAKADFRFAHALNVFQGLIDKAPTVEERKHGHWEDIDLDTSVCSVCKKPQEYETKAFVNAEFKLKIGVILPVTEEQFIEANKNIKEIVNTDTAIINCGVYGKGRIYHLEYTKLADSERGRL